MRHEEIEVRIRTVMGRVFELRDGSGISRSTSLDDIDGWDSLSHAMLVMAIESDLKVDLPLDRTSRAHDVGSLVDIVYDLLQ